MTEQKMITRIKNHDEHAIGEIINKYSKLLYKIAAAILKNVASTSDIEECVADAFIYLWEHPDKYDPARSNLKTYLALITRSKALDRYRELSKTAMISLDEEEFGDKIKSKLNILDNIIQKESSQALTLALNSLAEPQKEIFLRRYYYEQKPREIALALNLTTKQINNHLYQAKLTLRKILTLSDRRSL